MHVFVCFLFYTVQGKPAGHTGLHKIVIHEAIKNTNTDIKKLDLNVFR